tara:strand:+ start:1466 stop:1774 length:309 start_codon:yes stop_codon:yes gene_type:complete
MEEVNKKLDKLDNHMEAIKHLLITLNDKVECLEGKIENLNDKVDEEVLEECKKMGSHIDFVENVYDNVKHPLGYICKKIKGLTGSSSEQYTLTDLEDKDEVD